MYNGVVKAWKKGTPFDGLASSTLRLLIESRSEAVYNLITLWHPRPLLLDVTFKPGALEWSFCFSWLAGRGNGIRINDGSMTTPYPLVNRLPAPALRFWSK